MNSIAVVIIVAVLFFANFPLVEGKKADTNVAVTNEMSFIVSSFDLLQFLSLN